MPLPDTRPGPRLHLEPVPPTLGSATTTLAGTRDTAAATGPVTDEDTGGVTATATIAAGIAAGVTATTIVVARIASDLILPLSYYAARPGRTPGLLNVLQ